MAEDETPTGDALPGAQGPPADPAATVSDPLLGELGARLGQLHRSVELLGTQGKWVGAPDPAPAPEPAPGPPPGATEYSYVPGPAAAAGGAEAPPVPVEVPRYEPAASAPPPPPPAPMPPAPPMPPTQAPVEQGPPMPEPANDAAVSAPSSSVEIVDAGPFPDLIELRRFEDDLEGLVAVRDVRVRRFGQGRANIEVGMSGPYELERELPRLGREMQAGTGPEGELVLELAPTAVAEDELDPASEPEAG